MNTSKAVPGGFFLEYQKKNTLKLLKDSVEKIINEWLSEDDKRHTKLKNIKQLSEKDVDSNAFSEQESLPDYVTRLWIDPHQTLTSLNSNISKTEIRNLIKKTAENISLANTHEAAPEYS